MERALALRCTREHIQEHLEGKLTAKTAYYPKPMCSRAITRMLDRDPATKPISAEVNREVYAAVWEKLLGTQPPPRRTKQEADASLQRRVTYNNKELEAHARMLHGRGGHTQ